MDQEKFNQAFQSFARRENLPAELTSEQWSDVPREIRERSFFMSRVTDAEILQRFRDSVEDVLAGRKGIDLVDKELEFWLREKGYVPPNGEAGGLRDLSSAVRIATVINTNVAMARGHAQWVRKQTAIKAFPVQRLVRVAPRKEKRPWVARWREAMKKLGDDTKAVCIGPPDPLADDPLDDVVCAAPLNDPIWSAISIFDQPYPPYDWGSGVGVESGSKADAKAWGIDLTPPDIEPKHKSMNDGLEVTPDVKDPVLKEALTERLGRFGEWDGEKMVFTDPSGTKPYPAEKLAEIWEKPAPAGYDALPQKEALDKWDGGVTPDAPEDRVVLRQLFDRIVTAEPPPEVSRAFALDAEQAVSLIRGLAKRELHVPANVAGWEWSALPADALSRVPVLKDGWTVLATVKGSAAVKDLRALRPGKPGFVYVGGTAFRVVAYVQDVRTRQITLTLEEAKEEP